VVCIDGRTPADATAPVPVAGVALPPPPPASLPPPPAPLQADWDRTVEEADVPHSPYLHLE